jgi:hypothetical protein
MSQSLCPVLPKIAPARKWQLAGEGNAATSNTT